MSIPLSYQHKIVDRDQLVAIAHRARHDGKTIVHCHGCFDIVHPGHIRYLEFARRQGDLLVVSLTGDSSISKGPQRPYIPQELRAENLAALACVDLVYVDPNPTAEQLLEDVKPHVYVKGREYDQSHDPRFLNEKRIVERHGGRVIFSSGEIVFSSTRLIDTLDADPELNGQRLGIFCERHGVDTPALARTIDRFKGLRVLVVGDTVVDRYVFCDALEIASEWPMVSLKRLEERTYVGGAAIVARHVAALGAQASLLTAAASNEQTTHVEKVLEDEGVQPHLVRCRPSMVEKTRFLVEDAKILKVESAERVPLDSLAERKATAVLEEHSRSVDAVIFCDFGFGMLSSGFLQRVMPGVRKRVNVVSADVSGPRGNLLDFVGADLLTPTERELRSNLNDYDSGLSTAAYSLLAHTQARHLIVTLEKRGLVVFDRPSDDPRSPDWEGRLLSEHLASFRERPLDRLGGGDALLSAATLTMAAGTGLMHAAYLGNVAAALEIAKLGNIPVTADELRHWIERRPELAPRRSASLSAALLAPELPTPVEV